MTISIEKMKELEALANPGPWNNGRDNNGHCVNCTYYGDNPNFIDAAREFVPWSIAEIEKLQEENKRLKNRVCQRSDTCHEHVSLWTRGILL